jgi:hypothetical protein
MHCSRPPTECRCNLRQKFPPGRWLACPAGERTVTLSLKGDERWPQSLHVLIPLVLDSFGSMAQGQKLNIKTPRIFDGPYSAPPGVVSSCATATLHHAARNSPASARIKRFMASSFTLPKHLWSLVAGDKQGAGRCLRRSCVLDMDRRGSGRARTLLVAQPDCPGSSKRRPLRFH